MAVLASVTLLLPLRAQQSSDAENLVRITIRANQKAAFSIPRTIFGTFLEPIGNSTYNGLWAEVLQNPSFEENLWNAENVAKIIHERPQLAEASRLGLPLPWEPLDPQQGNRYEPHWGTAANSWRSLSILALTGAETGVRQQVYLPVHRELHYKASVYARRLSGGGELRLSLRQREARLVDGRVGALTEQKVAVNSPQWTKYNVELALPQNAIHGLEPVDFAISVEDGGRIEIDQASLRPADAVDGLDPEMVRLAKDMHTPLLRFGGNYTSGYHWQDGVGDPDKRVSMLNIAWGIPETNQFGTDEFLRFCRAIGAEPQIALNLGSGTAEEAAAWVRYVNEHWTQPSGLLWELGNELWGNWNLGYPTLAELPERTRAFAEAVHAADPSARLIATGQDPDVYQKWNAAQLTNPAGTFDYLSTHFVVTTNRVQQQHATADFLAEAALALPVGLGRALRQMQQQVNGTATFAQKAHLAFTEWLFIGDRGATTEAPSYTNMGGALESAGLLSMLLQNADVVPISDMTGLIEFAGIWKKRGQVYAAPSYYAFRMYASADIASTVSVDYKAPVYDVHGGVTRLPEIAGVPYLEVVAALNRAGDKLTLFVLNRNIHRDYATQIAIDGFSPGARAAVQVLRSDSLYEVNSETDPDGVLPVDSSVGVMQSGLTHTFPRASVTRIEMTKQR